MPQSLRHLALEIQSRLLAAHQKVVFAESCTAGLISATLATIPGASNVHCGSAVVYRLATKTEWLGVAAKLLEEVGAVSEPVARAMAEGVLQKTPEAGIAVSITGHLGPDAPSEQDGLIYVSVIRRGESGQVFGHRLAQYRNPAAFLFPGETEREQRQWAAVEFALTRLVETLCSTESKSA